ncbi:PD-(D/E)XK nuclease family protein [Coraliomargarita algicola]|uniref:PD-(D/E)XK nuclease family protein n=1 Tax=Coraliomargarita algicola TaxID=3092156 RepID=A0ABZ0RDZ7_9BACT|nr:PD-(D/E)XK nuclease family protein [Coraliomargarita sp. J2-16]WPJ94379.1 PD-(D/E)XK nuclease family protein [Coraliomargarita sp. J2-16]
MIQPLNPKPNGQCKVVALPMQSSDGALHHISASSLKLYLGCSLKYYFKKILKLEEPTSPAFQLGKAVHAGLQAFHLGRWHGKSHDEQTVLKAYHRAFLEQEATDPVQYKSGEREKFLEKGELILKAYLDSDHAKMEDIPLGVEVKLEEEFAELPSPLLGYVDLVRPGNIPVDFKTYAATPNVELEAFQHELQLTAYQLLIEEATGEAVEGRELVFLVKTAKPKIIVHRIPPATEAAKARFWLVAQAAIDGIYHERFYPQPGMACSWCSFRQECKAWTGGVS